LTRVSKNTLLAVDIRTTVCYIVGRSRWRWATERRREVDDLKEFDMEAEMMLREADMRRLRKLSERVTELELRVDRLERTLAPMFSKPRPDAIPGIED